VFSLLSRTQYFSFNSLYSPTITHTFIVHALSVPFQAQFFFLLHFDLRGNVAHDVHLSPFHMHFAFPHLPFCLIAAQGVHIIASLTFFQTQLFALHSSLLFPALHELQLGTLSGSQLHPPFKHFCLLVLGRFEQSIQFLFFQTHPNNAQSPFLTIAHMFPPAGDEDVGDVVGLVVGGEVVGDSVVGLVVGGEDVGDKVVGDSVVGLVVGGEDVGKDDMVGLVVGRSQSVGSYDASINELQLSSFGKNPNNFHSGTSPCCPSHT